MYIKYYLVTMTLFFHHEELMWDEEFREREFGSGEKASICLGGNLPGIHRDIKICFVKRAKVGNCER